MGNGVKSHFLHRDGPDGGKKKTLAKSGANERISYYLVIVLNVDYLIFFCPLVAISTNAIRHTLR